MHDGVKNLGGGPLGDVFPVFDVSAFGAYDVRGVIGETVTAGLYYRAARGASPRPAASPSRSGSAARRRSTSRPGLKTWASD